MFELAIIAIGAVLVLALFSIGLVWRSIVEARAHKAQAPRQESLEPFVTLENGQTIQGWRIRFYADQSASARRLASTPLTNRPTVRGEKRESFGTR